MGRGPSDGPRLWQGTRRYKNRRRARLLWSSSLTLPRAQTATPVRSLGCLPSLPPRSPSTHATPVIIDLPHLQPLPPACTAAQVSRTMCFGRKPRPVQAIATPRPVSPGYVVEGTTALPTEPPPPLLQMPAQAAARTIDAAPLQESAVPTLPVRPRATATRESRAHAPGATAQALTGPGTDMPRPASLPLDDEEGASPLE